MNVSDWQNVIARKKLQYDYVVDIYVYVYMRIQR